MSRFIVAVLIALALSTLHTAVLKADEATDKALFAAINGGDETAFTEALNSGANINAKSEKGAPALVAAILADQRGLAVTLVEKGANLDAQYKGYIGATALMVAVQKKDLALAAELLEAGASVDLRDSNGDPAINWAAYYGYVDFVELFLRSGASTKLTGHGNAREIAMRRGHQDLIRLLARHDKLPLPNPDTAFLIDMVDAGDLEGVQEALLIGVPASSTDFSGRPVLALAARRGNTEIISALLEKGAVVDRSDEIGFTALMEAARDGQLAAVRQLLEAGANPNHISRLSALSLGPIHMAALSGKADMVGLIVAAGADLDQTGRDGGTALMWCLGEGKYEAAARLLELGADATIKHQSGTSAAEMINAYGPDELKALLKNSARNE